MPHDPLVPQVEDGALNAAALAGTTLEPLTPFVDKLLVPRGLRAINQYGTGQTIDPHAQAAASKLTCALIDTTSALITAGKRYASARSLDHDMARQINPGGGSPLVLGVGNVGTSGLGYLSYSAPARHTCPP